MKEVIGKRKLSCKSAVENITIKDIDNFYADCMIAFGVKFKGNITRKINGAYLSPVEIEAFEKIFSKYGITENIWTDVD